MISPHWLLSVVLALGLVAPASADTVDVLRQNTLTLTSTEGKITTVLVKDSDDLEQVNGSGVWAAGFWRLDPERGFCWTARGEASVCINLPTDAKVGAAWDVKGPTGKLAWRAEIVPGRVDLRKLSGGAPHGGR